MCTHQVCLPLVLPQHLAYFQQVMDEVLQGIPQVIPYIDDILVTEVNEDEHLLNHIKVFNTYRNTV